MKLPVLPLVAVLFAAASCFADVKIRHTEPRRMHASAFTRFGELLGFHSSDPTRCVLFSNEKSRDGLFFDVELSAPVSSLPSGTVALVQIYVDQDRAPRSFKFPLSDNKSKARHLYLGLTDEPFVSATRHSPRILAWNISLLDASGSVLTSSPSATWSL